MGHLYSNDDQRTDEDDQEGGHSRGRTWQQVWVFSTRAPVRGGR